jgi:hypothetical protein
MVHVYRNQDPAGRGSDVTTDNRNLVGRVFTVLAAGLDPFIATAVSDAVPAGSDWTIILAAKGRANGKEYSRYSRHDPYAQPPSFAEVEVSARHAGE